MFKIGQIVVCVEEGLQDEVSHHPVKGERYRIRDIFCSNHTAIKVAQLNGLNVLYWRDETDFRAITNFNVEELDGD